MSMLIKCLITLFILLTPSFVCANQSLQSVENIKDVNSCFAGDSNTYNGFIDDSIQELKSSMGPKGAALKPKHMNKFMPEKLYKVLKRDFDCYQITYLVDDVEVKGFYLSEKLENNAKGADAEPKPLVVLNRGGNGGFGKMAKIILLARFSKIAKAGYVIMGSQYRDEDEFGGKDLLDVFEIINIAKKLPNVDPESVSMLGVSRGAMMTYMAARQLPELKSLIIWAGQSDLEQALTFRPAMENVYKARIPQYSQNKQQALQQRSAIHWVNEISSDMPILLLHGDKDKRVNVSHAQSMADRLKALNHPHQLTIYENGSHSLKKHSKQVMTEIIQWLNKNS